MAEVFLAVHRGPGGYEKRLVIKRVLPKLAADAHFLRLFFDEAKLHVQLSHGGLVPIFDFGRIGNDYFLAMEYIDGRDLAAVLDATAAPLPPACVAFLGQELARVLAYVHRQGLVHRDVTPRNVLISSDGEVKLADFGVAQTNDASSGGVRGTIAYMAPEQARGERVDARADLYALGIILAEAATGRRVRHIEGDNETKLALAAAAPRVSIEGPFAKIVARATAPDPTARYADAAELGAALEVLARSFDVTRDQAAATLAGRVRAIVASSPSSGELVAPAADGPATYFRDAATQASIVDEILAVPPAPALPPSRAWIALPLTALALAGAFGWRTLHGASDVPVVAPLLDAASAPVDAAIAPVEEPIAKTIVDPVVRPHSARPRPPTITPLQEGTLRVVCSPWCVVEIDGTRHGEDGRAHTLRLVSGRHRLIARRLEDSKERTLDVRPGEAVTVDLTFD